MKNFFTQGLFVVLSILFVSNIAAQTILKGKITDGTSGLVGATIALTKKGVAPIGTVANVDGEYQLLLDSGIYEITCSYTGYNTEIVSGFHVHKNQINVLNFSLKVGAQLSEVIVTGYGLQSITGRAAGVMTHGKVSRQRKSKKSSPQTSHAYYYNYAKKADKDLGKSRTKKPVPSENIDRDGLGPSETNAEQYNQIVENAFLEAKSNPVSTFSVDVDVASYANIRRYIHDNTLPPTDAIRIEEMINYFNYQYTYHENNTHPFNLHTELGICPWKPEHQLLMVSLKGKPIDNGQIPASNLVFLVDVSGSMNSEDKLPLVQESLLLLTQQLRPMDRVAIVVYAGAAGLVLPSTSGTNKKDIESAIGRLSAGGSTAGAAGIELAYQTARNNFLPNGNNRVILCTDGDFNVGVSSESELIRLIEKERESGIYLTVLGYGTGNYQDGKMQELADKGNGNHAYIDSPMEARKVLVKEFGSTLFTIAKDVKFQVEFNPAKVAAYRLIGYENRLLAKEDFNDDTKDAGEIGAGHKVTALYEIIPAGTPIPEVNTADALKYQKTTVTANAIDSDDLLNLKLRYKNPKGNGKSLLLEQPVSAKCGNIPSENFRLASAVAGFGLLLRQSRYKGAASYEWAEKEAIALSATDKDGYVKELADLIHKASVLSGGVTDK